MLHLLLLSLFCSMDCVISVQYNVNRIISTLDTLAVTGIGIEPVSILSDTKDKLGRKILSLMLINTLFMSLSPLTSLADDKPMTVIDLDEPTAVSPRALRTISTVDRKAHVADTKTHTIKLNKNDVSIGVENGRYQKSLEKERQKQRTENTRSKAERRKELCETLGRGC